MCLHGYFYRGNEKQTPTILKNLNYVLLWMSHSLKVPYTFRISYRVLDLVFCRGSGVALIWRRSLISNFKPCQGRYFEYLRYFQWLIIIVIHFLLWVINNICYHLIAVKTRPLSLYLCIFQVQWFGVSFIDKNKIKSQQLMEKILLLYPIFWNHWWSVQSDWLWDEMRCKSLFVSAFQQTSYYRVFQKFVPIVNCILRKTFNASLGKCKLIQVRNLSK